MAPLKEHFQFGLVVGGSLYIIIFAIAVLIGLFSSLKLLLLSFFGGLLALIMGSLLPDLDAPRSPVHDSLLVFLGSILTVIVQRLNPSYLPLLLVPLVSVWADRNYLPAHRGLVHSVGGAILFGFLLSAALYVFVTTNVRFCFWCGFSLTTGCLLHLKKDGWIRL
ncbi:MAG: metal-dependent hydrolase [Thaumarchaeota archaeon]|nr:metal-dependent hydrolase [Nitrososphaerota archaeon]